MELLKLQFHCITRKPGGSMSSWCLSTSPSAFCHLKNFLSSVRNKPSARSLQSGRSGSNLSCNLQNCYVNHASSNVSHNLPSKHCAQQLSTSATVKTVTKREANCIQNDKRKKCFPLETMTLHQNKCEHRNINTSEPSTHSQHQHSTRLSGPTTAQTTTQHTSSLGHFGSSCGFGHLPPGGWPIQSGHTGLTQQQQRQQRQQQHDTSIKPPKSSAHQHSISVDPCELSIYRYSSGVDTTASSTHQYKGISNDGIHQRWPGVESANANINFNYCYKSSLSLQLKYIPTSLLSGNSQLFHLHESQSFPIICHNFHSSAVFSHNLNESPVHYHKSQFSLIPSHKSYCTSSPYSMIQASLLRQNDESDGSVDEKWYMDGLDDKVLELLDNNPFLPVVPDPLLNLDPLTASLLKSSSIEELRGIIETNVHLLDVQKAGLVFVNLFKMLERCIISKSNPTVGSMYPKFMEFFSNSTFVNLLHIIERDFHELTEEQSVCLLVSLRNLGLAFEEPVLQKLLVKVIQNIDSLTLDSITRLVLYLRSPEFNHSVKAKMMPSLMYYLDNCSTIEEMHLINCCLRGMWRYAGRIILLKHAKKLNELLDSHKITSMDTTVLLKILEMPTVKNKSWIYSEVINKVLKLLENQSNPFTLNELIAVNSVCENFRQNNLLLHKVKQQAKGYLTVSSDTITQAELYLCLDSKLGEQSGKKGEIIQQLINSEYFETNWETLFKLVRSVGTSELLVVDMFWDHSLKMIEEELKLCDTLFFSKYDTLLRQVFFQYLYFDNNLGGSYRHLNFEEKIIEHLLRELRGNKTIFFRRMCNMAAFIIAYCGSNGFPDFILQKLQENELQFSYRNVDVLTRGLQLSLSLQGGVGVGQRGAGTIRGSQIMVLACIMDAATSRLGQNCNSLFELSRLCHASTVHEQVLRKLDFVSYTTNLTTSTTVNESSPINNCTNSIFNSNSTNRYSKFNTNLNSQNINIHKYNGISTLVSLSPRLVSLMHEQMSIPILRKLSHIYTNSALCDVQVLDRAVEYAHDNIHQLLGRDTALLLHCLYCVGHDPVDPEPFFREAAKAVAREATNITGLLLLRAVIALCHYSSLTGELIQLIFNVSFLDQLDLEIQHCQSKASYPSNVRKLLMEVNRSVCLDYPEAKVPWFHAQYCHDRIQAGAPSLHAQSYDRMQSGPLSRQEGFHRSVETALLRLLGATDKLWASSYSPYYYKMDFEFMTDASGAAVTLGSRAPMTAPTPSIAPSGFTRHCILLQDSSCYRFLDHAQQIQNVEDLQGKGSLQSSHYTPAHTTFLNQLTGRNLLKIRHLEQMGYYVHCVPLHEWQAMAMTAANSKHAYLRAKIWPQQSVGNGPICGR